MRRLSALTPLFFLLATVPDQVLAATTWCASHPNADAMLFCDDWDRDCYPGPPADPTEACAPGACCGGGLLPPWSPWTLGTEGGNECRTEDGLITSAPFSGRSGGSQYTGAPLPSFIRDKWGPAYSQVRGTDLTPLVLEYVMDFRPLESKMSGSNMYMELSAGGLQPLTDYALSDDCTLCGGAQTPKEFNKVSWPIICRQKTAQNQTPAGCGSLETAPLLPAIAAGAVAYLDNNPCHCGEARDHWPYTSHLAFFDGLQWWTLRQGLFPGGGTGGAIPGDFKLHTRRAQDPIGAVPGPMRVKLTIRSMDVKVELTYQTETNPSVEYSWCEIPRAYLGPFSLLTFGSDPSCKVNANTWTCSGDGWRNGIPQPPSAGTTSMDNIAIHGGQGYAEQGACCFPDTTCVEAYQGDCQVLGGQPGPSGSTCQTHACCPPLAVDYDMDGDVDLQDFGWFQTCLSGADVPPPTVPCRCADFDHDNDVDESDVAIFLGCLLGPEVPANPSCVP